jgi:hypothetical protein
MGNCGNNGRRKAFSIEAMLAGVQQRLAAGWRKLDVRNRIATRTFSHHVVMVANPKRVVQQWNSKLSAPVEWKDKVIEYFSFRRGCVPDTHGD